MNTNGTIAPHEGREIALLIEGKKPLAVIERGKQPETFRWLMDTRPEGLFISTRRTGIEGYEAIVVTSGNTDLIKVYRAAVILPESPLKNRILGHLFGYSPEDIEAFIANPPECDCDKCRGGAEVVA